LDKPTKRVRDKFKCPNCDKMLAKDLLERTFENLSDPATGALWKRIKFRPVLINYCVGDKRHEKAPTKEDHEIISKVDKLALPSEVATEAFPIEKMYHGSRLAPKGFTHVHHMFRPRAGPNAWCVVASVRRYP